MNRNYERTIGTALYLIDVSMLCAVFYAVWERVYNPQLSRLFYWRGNVFLVALYAIMLLLSFSMLNGDRPGETRLLETIASQTIGVLITDFAAYLILMIVFHGLLNPRPVAAMAGIQIVILFFWDWIAHKIYVHLVPPLQLLMVYDRTTDPELALKLSGAASRYEVAASIGIEEGREAIKALLPEYDAVLVALWDEKWSVTPRTEEDTVHGNAG